MRTILITNASIQAKALEASLVGAGVALSEVIRVVPRKRKVSFWESKTHRIKSLAKRTLSMSASDRKALELERECALEAKRRIEEFAMRRIESCPPSGVKPMEVHDVNSEFVESLVRSESPTLCVVWGVGILKERLLNAADRFLNAHSSILPHYKGARSEFWQCYNEDYEHVGVTVHFIDTGVDTGDVVAQFSLPPDARKEPHSLRAENTLLVLEKYPEVVKSMVDRQDFSGMPQAKAEGAKAYKYADITEGKVVELYKRLLRTRAE